MHPKQTKRSYVGAEMLFINSRRKQSVVMGVTSANIELADEVRKYPALYNKSHNDYHQSDVVENGWEQVSLKILPIVWRPILK